MSKQKFFKEIDGDLKNAIAKEVLKRQQYKCFLCSARQNSLVVKSGTGYSDPLDDFETSHYVKHGVKPIKIYLRVIQTEGHSGSLDPEDFKAFCPHHVQQELKDRISEIRKKNLEDLSNIRVRHIAEVKNFIFQCTGKMMLTKDCVGLIMRLEQVLSSK